MPLRNEHLSVLWPLFAVLIAIGLWLGVKAGGDNLLKNSVAPSGIGSLERAGNKDEAGKVIRSWNQPALDERTRREIDKPSLLFRLLSNDGRPLTEVAKRSLVFDLFFIVFYTSAMAVACLLAATEIAVRQKKRKESRLVKVGIRLAYLQILTAMVDVLENFALWRMLRNSTSEALLNSRTSDLWPAMAYVCSIAKYTLVALSLTYVLLAFIFWLADSRQKPARKVSAVRA
jgi:hypothetical protein